MAACEFVWEIRSWGVFSFVSVYYELYVKLLYKNDFSMSAVSHTWRQRRGNGHV